MKYFHLPLLLAVSAIPCLNAQLVLTLPGNGQISAGPGDLTGWGFTLDFTSDPNSEYALITGSDFCTGAQTSPCSSVAGFYTDFMANNFLIVGPQPESFPVITFQRNLTH